MDPLSCNFCQKKFSSKSNFIKYMLFLLRFLYYVKKHNIKCSLYMTLYKISTIFPTPLVVASLNMINCPAST